MPVCMLSRATSVPLTYTTAPSSATMSIDAAEGVPVTGNVERKYVVMYLLAALGPNPTTVASSPSP